MTTPEWLPRGLDEAADPPNVKPRSQAFFDPMGVIGSLIEGVDRSPATGIALGNLCQEALRIRTPAGRSGQIRSLGRALDTVVLPRWGATPVTEVTVQALAHWADELLHPADGAGSVSRRTVFLSSTIIRYAFQLLALRQRLEGEAFIGYVGLVVPVWTAGKGSMSGATGVGVAGAGFGSGGMVAGAGGMVVGAGLAKAGSRRGEANGIAWQIPPIGRSHLYVTDRSLVAVTPGGNEVDVTWRVGRSEISGVKKSVRVQLMRRFHLQFTDGSQASFFTVNRRSIPALKTFLAS